MTDHDAFEESCRTNDTYMANFTQSMSLMIGEFYKHFSCIGVSSVTGDGIDKFFEALEKAALEYESGYKVDLEQRKAEKLQKEEERQKEQLDKFKSDVHRIVIDVKSPTNTVGPTIAPNPDQQPPEMEDDDDDSDFDMAQEQMEYENFIKTLKSDNPFT